MVYPATRGEVCCCSGVLAGFESSHLGIVSVIIIIIIKPHLPCLWQLTNRLACLGHILSA